MIHLPQLWQPWMMISGSHGKCTVLYSLLILDYSSYIYIYIDNAVYKRGENVAKSQKKKKQQITGGLH